MKKNIFIVVIMVILTVIQALPGYDSLKEIFNFAKAAGDMRPSIFLKPDMLLVFVAFIGFRFGKMEGIVFGFIAGILQGIASTGTLGLNSFVYLNVGFFVGFFKNKIYGQNILSAILFVFLGSIFKSLIYFIINAFYFEDVSIVASFFKTQILFETLVNTLIAPLLFLLFERVAVFFEPPKKQDAI